MGCQELNPTLFWVHSMQIKCPIAVLSLQAQGYTFLLTVLGIHSFCFGFGVHLVVFNNWFLSKGKEFMRIRHLKPEI